MPLKHRIVLSRCTIFFLLLQIFLKALRMLGGYGAFDTGGGGYGTYDRGGEGTGRMTGVGRIWGV